MDATRDAIAAATRANVAIYGIDPRGLGAGADDLIEVGRPAAATPSLNLGARLVPQRSAPRPGQPARAVGGNRRLRGRQLRTTSPAASSAWSPTTAPTTCSATTRPTNGATAASARSKCKVRPPGPDVRARKGYVAARGRAEADKGDGKTRAGTARGARQPAAGSSGLPLALAAAVFKGARPEGRGRALDARRRPRPAAHREGRHLPQRPRDRASTAADYARQVVSRAIAPRSTLDLKPDSVPRLRAGGFRILNQIDLPPGRYQLRVAAREANTKRAGLGASTTSTCPTSRRRSSR